jgi:general stress protein 26
MNNAIELALSIIKSSSNAIIGSIDNDGYPNVKAMLEPREHDGIKKFYFTTNTSSMRVAQFKKNPKASLYFYNATSFRGLMLKGTMKVLEDSETKERIWHNGDEMYYPKGVTDPDYCVLEFTAQNGRIYQNFSSENFEI